MEYWPLKPGAQETPIGLNQATALLARVGSLQPGALASALLGILSEHVAVAQCTVFAYPPNQAPRIVSYADRSRTRELPQISHDYATKYFRLDGSRRAIASAKRRRAGDDGTIVVHRQSAEDVDNAAYREVCYDKPRISDRIALLTYHDGQTWLAVNFYRGREHGRFKPEEITCIETFAPFLIQLTRLHVRCHQYDNELGPTLIARLRLRFPALTKRDMDLLACIVDGQDADHISATMGIQPGSVQTYTKRIYRKLGISGQRELFSLMLSPVSTPAN